MTDASKKNPPPPLGAPTSGERPRAPSFEELQRQKDKDVSLATHLAVTQPGYPGPFSPAKASAAPAPKETPVYKTAPPPLRPAPPPLGRVATPVPPSGNLKTPVPRQPPKPTQTSMGSITTLPDAQSPFVATLDETPSGGARILATPTFSTAPSASHADETLDETVEKPLNAVVENVQVIASPASLPRRLASFAIDAMVLGSAGVTFLMVAASVTKAQNPPAQLGLFDAWLFRLGAWHGLVVVTLFFTVLLALAYSTVGAFLFQGRTLGRLFTGLRLVDKHGNSISPVHALTRATFSLVSLALFFAGFYLAFFDRRAQTLHDKLASTFVVRLQAVGS